MAYCLQGVMGTGLGHSVPGEPECRRPPIEVSTCAESVAEDFGLRIATGLRIAHGDVR